ncbi:hypothetical protein ABTM32_22090, partial [Acinetobacter baumannii]
YLIFETGLSRVIQQIKKDGTKIFFHRDALKDIEVLFLDSKGQIRNSVFNKCDQAIQDNFYQNPIIQILKNIFEMRQKIQSDLNQLNT